jgi:hypothetical protein
MSLGFNDANAEYELLKSGSHNRLDYVFEWAGGGLQVKFQDYLTSWINNVHHQNYHESNDKLQ